MSSTQALTCCGHILCFSMAQDTLKYTWKSRWVWADRDLFKGDLKRVNLPYKMYSLDAGTGAFVLDKAWWHVRQTRNGLEDCCGKSHLLLEQSLHTTIPHFLQWCWNLNIIFISISIWILIHGYNYGYLGVLCNSCSQLSYFLNNIIQYFFLQQIPLTTVRTSTTYLNLLEYEALPVGWLVWTGTFYNACIELHPHREPKQENHCLCFGFSPL